MLHAQWLAATQLLAANACLADELRRVRTPLNYSLALSHLLLLDAHHLLLHHWLLHLLIWLLLLILHVWWWLVLILIDCWVLHSL